MASEIPHLYLEQMQALLGDEYSAFQSSMEDMPEGGLRVNTLKLTPEKFLQLSPWELQPVPWSQTGYLFPEDERPGTHPYHAAGLYYLQEPSAMAVAEIAMPKPGDRVLDLAAAPGGKSTHLASLLENCGLLVVNDIHPKRVQGLAKNIERWGARNTAVLNETPARLAEHFGAYFDIVLVDAPCSGEGMFRKEPSMRKEWSPEYVEQCAHDQQHILAEARRLVRPGGTLVYSTCTFNSDENEEVIARFLESNPNFDIEAPLWVSGFFPGREDQVDAPGIKLHQSVRLWPHQSVGEGHFIAVLRKDALADDELEGTDKLFQHTELGSQHRVDVDTFWDQNLTLKEQPSLTVAGNHLYAIPTDMPDLSGLKVIHWGWWLGVMKKNRLDPSHAFAMGIRTSDVKRTYPLSGEDPKATAFLRGEVLRFPGPDGWMLVTIDDHPLGWGKRVNERIKSHVPNWLRYL